MPHFFITGTDTAVGKTWFTAWLVRNWRAQGHEAVALKPISSGDREDARLLREASGDILPLDEINPVHFDKPAAPLIAAQAENRSIDFPALNHSILTASKYYSHLAVEGVGGWRVPLASGYDVSDWARDLALPVVVVALNRLGVLNHTLLTVDSIHAAGLTCAAVVLNPGPNPSPDLDLARRDNVLLLGSLLSLPVFEFERGAETAGRIPVCLGGKEA